jgi:hypothetical protein
MDGAIDILKGFTEQQLKDGLGVALYKKLRWTDDPRFLERYRDEGQDDHSRFMGMTPLRSQPVGRGRVQTYS